MSFQHRSEVDQLRTAVDSGGTALLSQVLTGTGGVGKTQLAADYARTAWDSGEVDVLVWITASSRSAITAGYAQAGVELLAADPREPEQAARAFLAWLEPKADQQVCRWLVVLDDVADPADIRGWWPPASRHGRALVTTRRREATLTGSGRRRVTVGLFTSQEAAAYFTAVLAAHNRHEPTDQINSLAAELGYLPLALAQAATYILDAVLTCASYREMLADRIEKLADLVPEFGALPDDQTVTVAATWSLSIERANQIRPAGLARPMLQLAAMLDPNGIPAPVLTSEPALTYLARHRTRTAQAPMEEPEAVSPQDAVHALHALHRLSLIDHTPDTPHQAVRIHQLTQRAVRDRLPADQHDQAARTAADALLAAWPEIERVAALAQALRANTDALMLHSRDALWQPDGHPVQMRIGRSLGNSGQLTAAVGHFQDLADAARQRLGPDHRDTLYAECSLADWRREMGDVAGAVSAYEELVEHALRVLGPDHAVTFTARSGLAHSRGEARDSAGAVVILAEELEHLLQFQGPNDLGILVTRGHLAWWQGQAGDVAGAVSAYEELVEQALRVLGPDHRYTLIFRCNLAHLLGQVGDTAGAVTAYTELLEPALRVLGPNDPNTLIIRHGLALSRGNAGDATGAIVILAELLEHVLQRLDPDHPTVLAIRHDLAYWREETGDL
ncbi:NB-ARC domain-containing protein [Streptomyces sp. NPDC056549]|uniref:NB-ARC domain-containing protein n=1 Tax=Streptomyces sp. NPDC056549 TaxID=3345864 RepID=UPI0036BF1080